ncbi:MAG TPA: M20/M25/M40 family metallo-hydrolase [Holophagaceae bacterium]|nr:M20/M25/M40 family metallo-hydrolase [Holophagaceae bacterium]
MKRISALALCLCVLPLLAQEPAKTDKKPEKPHFEFGVPDDAFTSDVAKLLKEVADHQRAYADLQEMTDTIGPRLTGSQKLRDAQAWARKKLESYGAVNVHEEAYDFGRPWYRGKASARLLNCNNQELEIAQWAWTNGTNGPIKGEVALLEAKNLDELKTALPGLAGKIVLSVSRPRPTAEERKNMDAWIKSYVEIMKQAKYAAVLMSSEKDNGFLTMSGSPNPRWSGSTAPMAVISKEHANLIKRLIKEDGQHPQVELDLDGHLGNAPVQAYDVVAEIKGSTWPDQVVIVGGHQDSWDLSTGATDNGTGTVVAMETLRAIKALGVAPKRTIRVILFSGEEEGLLGSEAYVKAHMNEMKDIQAVLVDDMGTGQIQGWPDMNEEQWRGYLAQAMAPMNNLGCTEIGAFKQPGDTDHWPFYEAGVPAFAAIQDPLDYMTMTHHSQVDSLEHVKKDDLTQGAQCMASAAWFFANTPERVPHIKPAEKKAGN